MFGCPLCVLYTLGNTAIRETTRTLVYAHKARRGAHTVQRDTPPPPALFAQTPPRSHRSSRRRPSPNLGPELRSVSPEDALRLSPAQGQDVLGKLNLHPGQLPVGEELALPLHHLLQRAAEQGGSDDGPPAVVDLLQGGLTKTLGRRGEERDLVPVCMRVCVCQGVRH